jgi:maltose alpha-D-glucosyltransferase/alpha-amylase
MGDNFYLGDRNGVRTPMQWSSERNAGFSRGNPQRLYLPVIIDPEYHYETINVESQQNNPHSLLWWMKHLIALRKRFKAFGRGSIEFLYPDNHRVLAFLRRYQDECILVVANLSRFVQYAELDLSAFKGVTPVELFGWTSFPPVADGPYFVTLGPHAFYWFSLGPRSSALQVQGPTQDKPFIAIRGKWENVFQVDGREELEAALTAFLTSRPWLRSNGHTLRQAQIVDIVPLSNDELAHHFLVVRAEYYEGDAEVLLRRRGYLWGSRRLRGRTGRGTRPRHSGACDLSLGSSGQEKHHHSIRSAVRSDR